MSEQLGTCNSEPRLAHTKANHGTGCVGWQPVPAPAEPPHVACSCPMCCPGKYEINAALANAAVVIAGETTTLNRPAYQRLIAEDLEWLNKMPRSLERDHIEIIVEQSPNILYEPAPAVATPAGGKEVNLTAKKFAELEGWKFGKANQATAFKFAESYADRCLEIVVAAEDFENNLAQSFEDNRKIIGKLRATREPADLEGKLRELARKYCEECGAEQPGAHVCKIGPAIRAAAAFAHAEGRLEQFQRMKHERPLDPVFWDMHEERAIRALKEKV